MSEKVKVKLTPTQEKRLLKAISSGSDFSFRLAGDALDGATELVVGKIQAKKLAKRKVEGKGMVLKLSSSMLKKMNMKPQPDGKRPIKVEMPLIVMSKGKKKGGAISAGLAISALGVAKTIQPHLMPFVESVKADLLWMVQNPSASRASNIYVNRIPNLSFRWEKLGNAITFFENKNTKVAKNKINRMERTRANIIALIGKLLTQLPRLRQAAEEKNVILEEREKKRIEAEINKLEANIDSLKGEGMQVEPSTGHGLQIGKGMQVGHGMQIGKGKKKTSQK